MLQRILPNGSLHIADNVFLVIVALAIKEIQGVAGTVKGIVGDIVRIRNKNFSNGITIEHSENGVKIEIKVALYYGVNIRKTCLQIQQLVHEEVEAMMGINVQEINIKVEQVIVKPA